MAAHWLSIFLFLKKIPFLKCFQIFYISFPFLSFQPPPFSSPPCGPGDHPVSLHDIMREN